MSNTLGTIRGQMVLDVRKAIAAYTQARQYHISTVTALHTGAGAMVAAGAGIAAVGAGMAAGFLTAVGAAAEFERRLDYFSAVSDSTQAEYEAISDKALQLGADTIYSAGQIAESFVELAKSGTSAREILDGIGEAVANLGAATDMPLTEAATSLTTVLNTFGLQAEDAVAVVDKLAGAANSSSIDVQDLILTLTYAGASAKIAGIDFNDVNTAIALLGERGIKGSKAGTGLRQMFDKLLAPTKLGSEALRELGIITEDGTNKLIDMDGGLKPIPALLDTLNGSLANLTTAEKTDLLGKIFPITSLPTILNLLDGGSAGMARLNDEISKTTALDIAGERLDNLSGDLEILKGNIDTLLISGGSGFQEFARGFIQGITGLIQAFLDLPQGVQTTLVAIFAIIAVVLVVVGVLGLFAGAILQIIALAIQLGPVFAFIGGLLGPLAAGFRVLWAAITGPVGIVIAIIAAVVAALIWFFTETELGRAIWAEFSRFLVEAWNNIVNVAIAVWEGLVAFFSDLWINIQQAAVNFVVWISNIWNTYNPVALATAAWNGIVSFFTGLFTTIVNGVTGFIQRVVAVWATMPQRIGAFFAALPGVIGHFIGFLVGTVIRWFIQLGTTGANLIRGFITNVVNFFQQLPGRVIAFVTQLVVNVVSWFNRVRTQAVNIAQQLVNNVIRFFQQLPGRITAFIQQLVNNVVAWFNRAKSQAISIVTGLVQGVINFFQQLPGRVQAIIQNVVNSIVSRFNEAKNQAIRIAQGIFNGIRDAINGLPGLVTGIFNNVVGAIRDMIGNAFNAVADFASGLWEGFKSGLGISSPSYIEEAMWTITGVIDEETKHMRGQVRTLQGLGNRIANTEIGFNNPMPDVDLDRLYSSVAATRALEMELASTSTLTTNDANARATDRLAKAIEDLEPGDTYIDAHTENPAPEPQSDSLPRSIRKTLFLVGK